MPQDNKESYKEMYEMGERLMEMAKAGGYDPDESSEGTEEVDDYEDSDMEATNNSSVSSGDKVKSALSLFSK